MELGIIGLGVMGSALAKNAIGKGIKVLGYNRLNTVEIERINSSFSQFDKDTFELFSDLESFAKSFSGSRNIIVMLPSGSLMDDFIKELRPLLSKSDVLCDGGNSFYLDTERRCQEFAKTGIHYLGIGISGGELGALNGPAMMIGGSQAGYDIIRETLELIAAKQNEKYFVSPKFQGESCAVYMGKGGAGHYVKTIHNGLEYGQMQALAELYALRPDNLKLAGLLGEWKSEGFDSFLLRTAIKVLEHRSSEGFTLDAILDEAGAKGTGVWTAINAMEFNQVYSIAYAATKARQISSSSKNREKLAGKFSKTNTNSSAASLDLKESYRLFSQLNHHQALNLISVVSGHFSWGVDLKKVLACWSNGSIVESKFLSTYYPSLTNEDLLLSDTGSLVLGKPFLKNIILEGIESELYLPCFTAAWNYLIGISQRDSTANLIQGLRDAFGAHTYKKKNDSSGNSYHTNWENYEN